MNITERERMRSYLKEMYRGKKWSDKVDKMGDSQLTAVYLSLKRRAG